MSKEVPPLAGDPMSLRYTLDGVPEAGDSLGNQDVIMTSGGLCQPLAGPWGDWLGFPPDPAEIVFASRKVYGVAEMANIIGQKRKKILRWVEKGRLPTPSDRLSTGPVWLAEDIEPVATGVPDPSQSSAGCSRPVHSLARSGQVREAADSERRCVMKRRWSYFRWWLYKRPERIWMFVAWKLPRSLALWVAVRVIANATTGRYSNQIVPELTAMDALKRWEES